MTDRAMRPRRRRPLSSTLRLAAAFAGRLHDDRACLATEVLFNPSRRNRRRRAPMARDWPNAKRSLMRIAFWNDVAANLDRRS